MGKNKKESEQVTNKSGESQKLDDTQKRIPKGFHNNGGQGTK